MIRTHRQLPGRLRRSAPATACALGAALLCALPAGATSLKEMYDLAEPAGGYDKYIVLETGVTYTGGLFIGATFDRITAQFLGAGLDVRIVGNGAILDLQGAEICLAYCNNRLDIDDCIIINGGVKFRGYHDAHVSLVPAGSVTHVTFYRPHDYALRLFASGQDILIERNLIVDAVDTGPDFMYLSGEASDWLPTGTSVALSLEGDLAVFDNWSFHTDPAANADAKRHFVFLCDYG